MKYLNDKKINDTQRFLAMVLVGNKLELNKYLPNDNKYLPFISWVEGKELSQSDLNNMLIIMSEHGNPLGVILLLKYGADIHAENDRALRSASFYGHTETVKLLLKEGADIHVWDDHALGLASQMGHTETVKLLLEKGADIHANNDLAWASQSGHTETVKLLLEKGADIHANNDYALMLASENGHTETVKLLKSYYK